MFNREFYTRGTVGFDRILELLESVDGTSNYPPYNIEQLNDNEFLITLAVAGFKKKQIHIEESPNKLVISGESDKTDKETTYLFKSIGSRNFKQSFRLSDYVKVTSAKLESGLLYVNLTREVPEKEQPRTVEIK